MNSTRGFTAHSVSMLAHAQWTTDWTAGLWMVLNMSAALVLGWIVGYERHFSGRAAGSQAYCLVCTTSCAVTLLAGYPALWYWGSVREVSGADPTRVIGAILTGIGFLGAGIVVKTGLNIRGLTTAASIWGSSAIGILVGTGFYVTAARSHCAVRGQHGDRAEDRTPAAGQLRQRRHADLLGGVQAPA